MLIWIAMHCTGADPGYTLGGGVRGNRARSEEFRAPPSLYSTFEIAEPKTKNVFHQF
jgi:hypothetical protein